MKKALFALLILALVLPVFADDALVMPARVIRTYLVGNLASVSKVYDSDGKKQDADHEFSVFNLGMAVEYGINDWFTGALQWVPGYNLTSSVDGLKKATLADTADLFIGAKIQIVGPKAPVKNETIRFAIAPGFKVPLAYPDWKEEYANMNAGDTFLASPADRHTLAIGARGYFDYIINEMFFLNLYSQFLYYPGDIDLKDAGLTEYGTWKTLNGYVSTYNPTLNYGYDLTLEFEPHFSTMISDGLELSAGLPVSYNMTPEVSMGGNSTLPSALQSSAYTPEKATSYLTVGPNASLFFQKTFLPIELKVGYTIPLAGESTNATNVLLLELKAYAKF